MVAGLIGRRGLLGGASAGAMLAGAGRAFAVAGGIPPAPVAPVEPVRDTYFGTVLTDRYRWMENDRDRRWLPFMRAENAHARAVLDRIPGRDRLAARIAAVSGDVAVTRSVQRAGGRTFFQQRPAGADNYRLLVKEGGAARVLVDPTALAEGASGHMSLDWWRASPDGTHVVYGLSPNGSEDSVLHVLSVSDGRVLPERIADTEDASPSWLGDGTGFFYNQLTGRVDTPQRYLDSRARFHRLGTDPASDPVLVQRGLAGSPEYEMIQLPVIATFEGSDQAVLLLSDVRPESRMFIAPVADAVAGRAKWQAFATFADQVTGVEIRDGDLYVIGNAGAPLGRVLRMPVAAPDLARATVVVPQTRMSLDGFERARDGLYLTMMDGGVSRLRRMDWDGHVAEIALPFDGTVDAVFADPAEDGALMTYGGWLVPTGVWGISADGRVSDTGLNPVAGIDVGAYATERGFATVRDGTRVPYSLIFRKGAKRDGSQPAWIQAYGSYGLAAYTPNFVGKLLALVDAGFTVGFANVRGGGEYGRPWHRAGQLENKPNTWRDLIDVCEHLCATGVTAKTRLAIGGRSAGGITVGRALTERPDLFAAVIDGVGWSNPLRYVAEQNGAGEEPEWGRIDDPAGFRALRSIDSYQAVRDGTAYPAVLLTTGLRDPRVAPFHVAKMTARLQAATSSKKPILLRVDTDAGHGIGSTRGQADREAVDTYAFLLWQTGVRGYQPVG